MPGSSLTTTRRLALAGMFAGVAWGAGYVESIPNFEFLTVILFAAGWALGPLWGAFSAALGMFLFSVINPYGSGLMHPLVLASQVLGMALAGAAGGALGRLEIARRGVRFVLVVAAGVCVTALYDLLTNAATALVYGQWKVTMIGAIPFALIHIGTNAVLFASVGVILVTALERTRRSLAPAAFAVPALVLSLLALETPPARAQVPVPPPPGAVADSVAADSTKEEAKVRTVPEAGEAPEPVPEDSVAYRDKSRAVPPPAWGDGPARLLRRDDWNLATALTREGGFVERFDDAHGSAEPLGRFGLAGQAVLVRWLGLPLTGVGAIGGETVRVPWGAVQALETPRLPVSAREAYRGALGEVVVTPWAPVPGHPRVEAWAHAGGPQSSGSGFTIAAGAHGVSGFLGVESSELGPLPPLGPEGDHGLAFQLAWVRGPWTADGAYRSNRQALENDTPRLERRRGEAGRLGLARTLGAWTARASLERTADSFVDEGDAIGFLTQRGKGGRGEVSVDGTLAGGHARAALTAGQDRLESEGTVAFDRRARDFDWLALSYERALGARTRLDAALGGGRYGEGGADVAPSLRFDITLSPRTLLWFGGARGLSATVERRSDADLVAGEDPLAQRSAGWLGGVGVAHRSASEVAGGSWRGAWPKGEMSARAALYAGTSDPGFDPSRFLLAGEAAEGAGSEFGGSTTKFAALVATGAWAPLAGLVVEAGGHGMGRSLDSGLTPSDPEFRGHVTLETRHVVLHGDVDFRVSATGEWIGPRAGSPAGDLPGATRLGLGFGFIMDEFEVRAAWRNLAGSNRLLPLFSPALDGPTPFEQDVLLVEARWAFWD